MAFDSGKRICGVPLSICYKLHEADSVSYQSIDKVLWRSHRS